MEKMSIVHIDGRPIEGHWLSQNLFMPKALMAEWDLHPLKVRVWNFLKQFPDQLWAISSIWSSSNGQPRPRKTSHWKGWSIDAAPLYSHIEGFRPDRQAPNMCDNWRMLRYIKTVSHSFDMAIFAEDDHFHFDTSFDKGVYSFISRHATYKNVWDDDPANHLIYEVNPNYEMILYSQGRNDIPIYRPPSLFGESPELKRDNSDRIFMFA